MDTEHGFVWNIKAILAGFRQILEVRISARIGGKCRSGAKAQDPLSENSGDFIKPFIWGKKRRVVV